MAVRRNMQTATVRDARPSQDVFRCHFPEILQAVSRSKLLTDVLYLTFGILKRRDFPCCVVLRQKPKFYWCQSDEFLPRISARCTGARSQPKKNRCCRCISYLMDVHKEGRVGRVRPGGRLVRTCIVLFQRRFFEVIVPRAQGQTFKRK